MSIYERLSKTGPEPHFGVHIWAAIVRLWFLDALTNQEALDTLELHGTYEQPGGPVPPWTIPQEEIDDMTDLRAIFDALNANGQVKMYNKLESIGILIEHRPGLAGELMTLAKAKAILGVT